MAERVDLHLGIGVDTRDFATFAKALRKAAPEIAEKLRVGLTLAGAEVAEDARTRAGQVSQTIPPSIKVRVSGATVSVVAGGKKAPLAGLFELGNKPNRKTTPSTFGHPVFGSTAWVRQPTHPFLAPAVRDHVEDAARAATEALDAAIAEAVTGNG